MGLAKPGYSEHPSVTWKRFAVGIYGIEKHSLGVGFGEFPKDWLRVDLLHLRAAGTLRI
jgi:hypothetical protein